MLFFYNFLAKSKFFSGGCRQVGYGIKTHLQEQTNMLVCIRVRKHGFYLFQEAKRALLLYNEKESFMGQKWVQSEKKMFSPQFLEIFHRI